jgi:DNA-binding NarL/FixJ family response regulator
VKYVKGQSGNPAGRPAGSKHKSTELLEMLRSDAPAIVLKALSMARDGDPEMIKLVLNKLLPNAKDNYIDPIILIQGSLAQQSRQVIDMTADGQILPSDADTLLKGFKTTAELEHFDELKARLERIEKLLEGTQ